MQELMVASFDSTQLYLKKDIPEDCRALVVLVHGLCEYQGRYDYFTERLNSANIGVYRFDHRGHGRSEGERTFYNTFHEMVDDTDVIVELARKEHPELPLFMVGHSMGGFCAAAYGAKYPGKVKGIVLSGGLTRDHVGLMSGKEPGQDPHVRTINDLAGDACTVPQVSLDFAADPLNVKDFTLGLCYSVTAGIKYLEENAKCFTDPVLMLHGEEDSLVAVQDTYDLFGMVASKDRQMKIYGGLYHEIFNEYCRDEVIDDAANWILNRI